MFKFAKNFLVILSLIIITVPAFADDTSANRILSYGEDRWLSMHLLLQAQAYSQNGYQAETGYSETDDWTKSFVLRRARIILNGQVTKDIDFFMETDDLNIGGQSAGSQYSTTTTSNGTTVKDSKGVFTQDAYINYKVADALEVTVGLMPLPFMHQNLESAVSLLGVDYNSTVIPLGNTSNNWRDTGVQIRGLWRDVFSYRFGIFRGQPKDLNDSTTTSDDINPDSDPRFCGRIQLNFADPETGFFYSGNYLGKKNVISFGAGFDYQHNSSEINNQLCDYFAFTADLTSDYRISQDLTVTGQTGYVHVSNQPGASVHIQKGFYGQAGVLLYDKYQPVIKYQYWNGDTAYYKDVTVDYISIGFNYFIKGHNANIKFEYQNPLLHHPDVVGDKKATIQCQLFI
jgi:hypothetical protein